MINALTAQWLHFIESEYAVTGPALAMGLVLLFFSVMALFFQYLTLRRENRIFQMELGINTRIDEKNYELNERLLRLNEQVRNMAMEIDPSLSLFEQCREPLAMVCEDRILDLNHSAMTLFGFSSKDEWLTKTPLDLFPDKQSCGNPSPDLYHQAVKTACEQGYIRATWQYLRGDRDLIHGDTIISTIQRCGKQVLLMSIREKESDVKITPEVSKSQGKAIKENDEKNNFLATLTYEILIPLKGIIDLTDRLKDTGLNNEQTILLATISQDASALLSVVNDILDFSKITTGKLALEKIVFNFSIMMESLSHSFALHAQRKGLDFHLHLSQDIPIHLQGDPGKLRQILMNLLGNALKFTDHGEITLGAERVSEHQGQVELLFKVKDTGIGIPLDRQSSLFERATQADSGIDPQYGGVGMGTSIAKQLVERMGGKMEFVSSPGQGSVFSFTAFFDTPSSPVSVTRIKKSLDQLRILVVGSTADNRSRVIRHLKYKGCHLDEASSETETLSLLEWTQSCNKPYDIIIMELYMNDMDGFTLTSHIRSRTKNRIPVLVVTASGRRGDARQCTEHGIDGYLTWPFKQDILITAIESLSGIINTDSYGEDPSLVTCYSILEDYKSDF